MSSTVKMVYAGAEDEKEINGILFLRLQATDVPSELVRGLATAKPRIVFMDGEKIPEHLQDEYLMAPLMHMHHMEAHAEQYRMVAYQYTDDKDEAKREGALSEVAWAKAQIEAAQAERDRRWKAAKDADVKRAQKAFESTIGRLDHERKAAREREKAAARKHLQAFNHMPDLQKALAPDLAGI